MRWNSEERRRYGEVADEGGESDSGYGYTNLPDISPNADWMQRGWVNYAGSSGLPFNQVVTTMPPHARGWNESWEEEEEVQQDEDPPGLHEVGQLHARIRMVRLEDEEEEEHEEEEVQKEEKDEKEQREEQQEVQEIPDSQEQATTHEKIENESQVREEVAQPVDLINDSQIPDDAAYDKSQMQPESKELGSDDDEAKGTFKASIKEHVLNFIHVSH